MLFCLILNFSFSKRDHHARDFYEVYYPESNMFWGIWNTGFWIDENQPEAKIAYSGFHFHYPLIGGRFQRSADYININECTKCRYVDFKRSKDSIRRDPNFENWILNLSFSNIDYIVIDSTITPGVKSYEEEWAQSYPEDFQLVKKYNSTVIYKFLER